MGKINSKTGEATDEAKAMYKQFHNGQIDMIRLFEQAKPATWVQTQLEFALRNFKGVDLLKTDVGELAKKLSDTGTREELGKIAGLDADMMRWIQKMVLDQVKTGGEQLKVSEMLAAIGGKYGARADDAAKDAQRQADQAIKKQTRPVTDAIEQMVERWITRIYITLRRFFNAFKMWAASPAEKAAIRFENRDADFQEQMILLNEQSRKYENEALDATTNAAKQAAKDKKAAIDKQLEQVKAQYDIYQAVVEKGGTENEFASALVAQAKATGKAVTVLQAGGRAATTGGAPSTPYKGVPTVNEAALAEKALKETKAGVAPETYAYSLPATPTVAVPTAGGAAGTVVNDNRTMTFVINQNDKATVQQEVRKGIYHDKKAP
jgi:hypothetical protein